ncbi:hypothetical protein Bca4012_081756 [Brassica carinata]|uniref:Uncharacterized protein n=1 Tax=Brassica carinata TaxID=52824 RepID=A0A8X8AR35_BRACI|nr:hypothetical protein Bca52824_029055 [Brassica carinata]
MARSSGLSCELSWDIERGVEIDSRLFRVLEGRDTWLHQSVVRNRDEIVWFGPGRSLWNGRARIFDRKYTDVSGIGPLLGLNSNTLI